MTGFPTFEFDDLDDFVEELTSFIRRHELAGEGIELVTENGTTILNRAQWRGGTQLILSSTED